MTGVGIHNGYKSIALVLDNELLLQRIIVLVNLQIGLYLSSSVCNVQYKIIADTRIKCKFAGKGRRIVYGMEGKFLRFRSVQRFIANASVISSPGP